jgi:CRISPR/Cas system-associated endonuclease Cas1
MELYRYLINDFLIQYCQTLRVKDFITKTEIQSKTRKGKREYLNETKTRDLMKRLDQFIETTVNIPRIRVGKRQTLETLINEEALLFSKFLRHERESWIPRMTNYLA